MTNTYLKNYHKKALCFVSDTNYFPQTKFAIESAKQKNPDYKIILLSDGIKSELADINLTFRDLKLDKDWWIFTGRPAILKYALKNLNFDYAMLVDGDTYTYNSYKKLEDEFEKGASVIVIPHLLKPLPIDNFFPELRQISLMGNYNAGMFGSSQKGLEFILWLTDQTKKMPHVIPSLGLAAEQGWLRYAADFDENTKIFRNPGYNIAYWNIKQRDIARVDDTLYADGEELVLMHFSGLKKDTEIEKMSIHQNRYILDSNEEAYRIFKDYKKLIWGK